MCKLYHYSIAILALGLILGCGPDPDEGSDEGGVGREGEGEGEVASAPASDPGCPPAITVTSGLGPREVPILVLVAEGIANGNQMGLLRNEFNHRAALIGFEYCMAQACLSEYIPANDSHIQYETRNFGGWTEMTITPTGGQPQVLPPNTNKRAGIIVPPSPNVICKTPPPLPPEVQDYDPPPPVWPDIDDGVPEDEVVNCNQPTWSKPAGTLIVEKQFPFDPVDSGAANDALLNYVNNWLQNDINIKTQAWVNEIDAECARLNPGLNCRGKFATDPVFTTASGDSGLGSQVFMTYKVKLGANLTGACEHQD